jgi:Zn-dependent peptidase ImmA (M78 family)
LQHGFKARAERISADVRNQLGLKLIAPLCPWALAKHLGIIVLKPEDLSLSTHDVHQLTVVDPDAWSAMTVREAGLTGVVVNPTHPKARQRNSLMHEIAHIYLRHVGHRVDISEQGLLLVSDFSPDQEEEADWLAGALLIPREALLAERSAGATPDQICVQYGVSKELCNWRLRMTGIEAQIQNRRRRRF